MGVEISSEEPSAVKIFKVKISSEVSEIVKISSEESVIVKISS